MQHIYDILIERCESFGIRKRVPFLHENTRLYIALETQEDYHHMDHTFYFCYCSFFYKINVLILKRMSKLRLILFSQEPR